MRRGCLHPSRSSPLSSPRTHTITNTHTLAHARTWMWHRRSIHTPRTHTHQWMFVPERLLHSGMRVPWGQAGPVLLTGINCACPRSRVSPFKIFRGDKAQKATRPRERPGAGAGAGERPPRCLCGPTLVCRRWLRRQADLKGEPRGWGKVNASSVQGQIGKLQKMKGGCQVSGYCQQADFGEGT